MAFIMNVDEDRRKDDDDDGDTSPLKKQGGLDPKWQRCLRCNYWTHPSPHITTMLHCRYAISLLLHNASIRDLFTTPTHHHHSLSS